MRRLLLLLPLFALAGCKDPQDGVRVIVKSTGFTPGCIKVTAEDDASKEMLSSSLAGKSSAVVGILLPEKWGTLIHIKAEAFEGAFEEGKACEAGRINNPNAEPSQSVSVTRGAAKKDAPQEITLNLSATDTDGDGYVSTDSGGSDCKDGNSAINPGAAELCNDIDDNCSGGADEGFNLGAACTSPDQCTGTYRCNPTDSKQNTCFTPNVQQAWVDMDGDRHGDMKQGQVVVCTATLPTNRLPLSEPHDDCDDSNGAVKPGVQEICNDIDDNCGGGVDEGFNIGGTCNDPDSKCTGANTCNVALGTAFCKPNAGSPSLYPDDDADNFGRADGGVIFCGTKTGYVASAGDCNDGNRFIHDGAQELCDGQDNNCNTMTDEGACAAGTTAKWVTLTTTTSEAFRSVALYGDGGVWTVGNNSIRAVKEPQNATFAIIGGVCPPGGNGSKDDLYSVWAHPESGTAYIGGENDILSIQTAGSTNCDPAKHPTAKDTTTGIAGFAIAGGVQLFGVASQAGIDGDTFDWDGGVVAVPVVKQNNMPLFDIAGVSNARLFAVGGKTTAVPNQGQGYILERTSGSSTWSLATIPAATDWLKAVDVVTPSLAYAVGDNGTLLKWDGLNWQSQVSPSTTEEFTGVLSFGTNSIYISTENGIIYQYDGTGWSAVSTGNGLYDIEGNNPGDIWAVGGGGSVRHFTSAP